jgi:hypothetical protein
VHVTCIAALFIVSVSGPSAFLVSMLGVFLIKSKKKKKKKKKKIKGLLGNIFGNLGVMIGLNVSQPQFRIT